MIISFASQKGGSGKTTSALNIGAALHKAGMRVLFIDLDQQSCLTQALVGRVDGKTTSDVLQLHATIQQASTETPLGTLVAADGRLAGINSKATINVLQTALKPLKTRYDVILLDLPPQLGVVTLAALASSDGVIIPLPPDKFGIAALGQIAAIIKQVQEVNALTVLGVLVCRFNARSNSNQFGLETIKQQANALNMPVYKPPIRNSVAVQECMWTPGTTIFDTRSRSATDYQEIADQVIRQIKAFRKGV